MRSFSQTTINSNVNSTIFSQQQTNKSNRWTSLFSSKIRNGKRLWVNVCLIVWWRRRSRQQTAARSSGCLKKTTLARLTFQTLWRVLKNYHQFSKVVPVSRTSKEENHSFSRASQMSWVHHLALITPRSFKKQETPSQEASQSPHRVDRQQTKTGGKKSTTNCSLKCL